MSAVPIPIQKQVFSSGAQQQYIVITPSPGMTTNDAVIASTTNLSNQISVLQSTISGLSCANSAAAAAQLYGEVASLYNTLLGSQPFVQRNLGNFATSGTGVPSNLNSLLNTQTSGPLPTTFPNQYLNAIYLIISDINNTTGVPVGLGFTLQTLTDSQVQQIVPIVGNMLLGNYSQDVSNNNVYIPSFSLVVKALFVQKFSPNFPQPNI